MKALYIEPFDTPKVIDIENRVEVLQEKVGGLLQGVYPFIDDVAILCDDEGKLKQEAPNRVLCDDDGNPYDVICGPFLIVGIKADDFTDLSEELIQKYKDMYQWIEVFPKGNDGHIYWVKLGSEDKPRKLF